MPFTKEQAKEEAGKKIYELVLFYEMNKSKLKGISETDTRVKFIDRVLEFLGWDVYGKVIPDEVQREETVKFEKSKKKADYILKINGVPQIIIEAKAFGEDTEDRGYQKQAIEYAYNKACSWAILTNFKQFRIFFVNRKNIFSPFYVIDLDDTKNFDENFEMLWYLSKEFVKNDELIKEAHRRGIKKEKIAVDEQLFNDLRSWRKTLSEDIKKRYGDKYEAYVIDEIVQRIIDRLIFIRKTEDGEMEERRLDQLIRKYHKSTYDELKKIFLYYNSNYDSKIFGSGKKDLHIVDEITISNEVIETVIRGMYTPKGSDLEYNFDAIDADVLGNIYEQYLAFILAETPKSTKLRGGIVHRKEQGIYYTPTYIVDYIIKNTLGEFLRTRSPKEIKNIKVLDPACGSGSFLIKVFDYLLKYHLSSSKASTLEEFTRKVSILKNNIYGVDLDPRAVEITQLNLLLKALQKSKSLPMLQNNIKIGNSLIDNEKIADDEFFDWNDEFTDIMKDGGFNIVIGNPPYVRVDKLRKEDKEYWKEKFHSSTGKYDIYYLFIESVFKWLEDGGRCGFIVPNKFCAASSAKTLRDIIFSSSSSCEIVSISHLDVFKDAANYPLILILTKGKGLQRIKVNSVFTLEDFLNKNFISYEINKSDLSLLPSKIIPININQKQFDLVIRLIKENEKLLKYLKISEGLRIPQKFESENKKKYEMVKQYQFERYSSIKKGSFISENNLRKVISPDSERYKNSLKEKILIAEDALYVSSTIDKGGRIPQGGIYFGVLINDKTSIKYIISLLNSKLMSFVYKILFGGMHMGGGYLRYRTRFLEHLPIKISNSQEFIKLVNRILSLNKKLDKIGDKKTDERRKIEEKIERVNKEIDQKVYKLYGLTPEEIKIVEDFKD